jgi:hypothetical protein
MTTAKTVDSTAGEGQYAVRSCLAVRVRDWRAIPPGSSGPATPVQPVFPLGFEVREALALPAAVVWQG